MHISVAEFVDIYECFIYEVAMWVLSGTFNSCLLLHLTMYIHIPMTVTVDDTHFIP